MPWPGCRNIAGPQRPGAGGPRRDAAPAPVSIARGKTATTAGQKEEGPDRVILEFLEAARTGNNKQAAQLLTPLARQKVAGEHIAVVPPSTDKAHFEVGAVEFVGTDGARVYINRAIWMNTAIGGPMKSFGISAA